MHGSKFDDVARGLGRGASRRTLVKGLAGGVAGALFGGLRRDASARTLTICHATGNPDAPYETLTIQQAEFNLHARHGDFLRVECCADDDCAALDSACGSGTCETGYCVQLPTPAGAACRENACFSQGICDGALTCAGGDTPVACEAIDACHLAVCDPSGGCMQTPNEGTSCTPDDTHDGTCDPSGLCQPILVCTAAPTCQSSSDCPNGATCVNGGCFTSCDTSGCSSDCTDCDCMFTLDESDSYCLDANTYIAICQSNDNCPSGSLCSGFPSSPSDNYYLCTQPCAHKQ